MKVCKVENFPGDKIECKNCNKNYWCSFNKVFYCLYRYETRVGDKTTPPEGCRDDCPLIPCEGIKGSLEFLDGMVLYEGSIFDLNKDSIKFIKACEEGE